MARELVALVPGLMRLGRVGVFAGLPERDLAVLDRRLEVVRWIYGHPPPPALSRPRHLFVVREGQLALFERTLSGHLITIAVLEAGAVYSSLGDAPAPHLDAQCDSAVSPISEDALGALIARYPRFGSNLAAALSERMAMLREIAAVLGEVRVEDRLRARLRQIGGRIGRTSREGVRIPLALTHAQWALLVGASRESVTIALGRLRAQGEILIEGREVTVTWAAMEPMGPEPEEDSPPGADASNGATDPPAADALNPPGGPPPGP
ncbi:MAG: family transcriptional regulator, cyclic receptor protein [Miltoncostaeaceae bacterium]|jgi:CRP/FNR family transcriptional regulator|nr:family transcriptional regulator, cyclic receptor protein [Miltoncostaeaceae bacterium]